MIRVFILVSLGTIISAISITDFENAGNQHNLARLFGLNKRNAVASKKERTLCESEECKFIAKVYKESMDDTVDPCDDFYEYACGNWMKNNPIPDGQKMWNLWMMVETKVSKQVKELIEKETKHDDMIAVKMAKKWYKSCMDLDRIDKTGLESILNSLWRHGGWPLIMEDGEWDDRVHTWQKVDDHYARLTGLNAFHDARVRVVGWDNDTVPLVFVDTPHLPDTAFEHLKPAEPVKHGDSSDENNKSGEISHETGSEEVKVSSNNKRGKDTDDDEEDKDENDEDDQGGLQEKRKLKTKVTHKKEKGHKSKTSRKRSEEHKTKKRIKRGAKKLKIHNNKHIIHPQNYKHDSMKRRVTVLKHTEKASSNDAEESAESREADEGDNKNEESESSEDDEGDDKNEDAESSEDDDADDENEDAEEDTNKESNENDDNGNEDSDDVDEEYKRAYKNAVRTIASALAEARGVEISEEKINKGADDLLKFQKKLEKLSDSWFTVDQTLDDFQRDYDTEEPTTSNGKVNWVNKIQKLFAQAGSDIDADLEVTVYIKYFKGLRSLLDETPSETIVNYVHWNFIVHMLKAAPQNLRHLYHKANDTHNDRELRSQQCIQEVELSNVMSYEYARHYFPDKLAQTAMDMIDDIQKEVELQIEASTWMDEETRQSILDKLVYMKLRIGYPEWYKNTTAVKYHFQGLTVGPSYYENTLSYMRFRKWKELQQLTNMELDSMDEVDPLMVNAFFNPDENSIAVSAADFQHPLFALNRPWYINFAIIGYVMAHEINHAFDTYGHRYDKMGLPIDWLPAMAKAYNKRAYCFVDQYNNYELGPLKDNITIEDLGNRTSGENIADTMALHTVLRAYRRRERECQQPDPSLPGLEDFTNDQLFFLSVANMWCQNADESMTIMRLKYDSHSPAKLRVIGPLSNSEDFAKAFNCPAGSPMNREKKCNIWE